MSKFKKNQKILVVILLSLVVACTLTLPVKADFKNVQTGVIERMHIFYVPPEIETFIPITKEDIERRNHHEIITENEFIIRKITKKINEFSKWIEKKPPESSYRAKIKLHNKNGEVLTLYVDNGRFFEFGDVEGRIPYEEYRQFMGIFENLGNTVDMRFLDKLKTSK